MKLYVFAVAVLVFIVDALTKSAALSALAQGKSIKVIPGIFHLTLVLNKGAAFGIFKDKISFFIMLSIAAVILITFYTIRKKNLDIILSSALGLILAGTAGNLLDRIRLGYVIDFFDFRIWPVFNVADSAITIGVAILMLNILLRKSRAR